MESEEDVTSTSQPLRLTSCDYAMHVQTTNIHVDHHLSLGGVIDGQRGKAYNLFCSGKVANREARQSKDDMK